MDDLSALKAINSCGVIFLDLDSVGWSLYTGRGEGRRGEEGGREGEREGDGRRKEMREGEREGDGGRKERK